MNRQDQLREIALRNFLLTHFQMEGRDSLDFVDVSRAAILAALEEAFEAGRADARQEVRANLEAWVDEKFSK